VKALVFRHSLAREAAVLALKNSRHTGAVKVLLEPKR
jgi:hypothetical protein